MLDDLRNSSAFLDEEEPVAQEEVVASSGRPARRSKEPFLGLTPQQRFILSLMVFFMVFVLGMFALVITGSISLPF